MKVLNGLLNSLRLEKHPEKTFVGKTERGFDFLDFLGYPIRPDGISVASKTLERFVSRAARLYEREPVATTAPRLGPYVRRWTRWVRAGLS